MSLQRKIAQRTKKRALRVRKKLAHSGLPRISVFRSSHHIYAQVIDDQQQKTLASFSSQKLKDTQGDKTAIAHAVGIELAKEVLKLGINNAVYDRGEFLYHGRIKALAQGLREGGLNI